MMMMMMIIIIIIIIIIFPHSNYVSNLDKIIVKYSQSI